MSDSYTYTSTTTDSNGNVVSETKKSSTNIGGTEKIKHVEKFPYVTYDEQNIVLDQDRYVGEPGKVEVRNNAIGFQTLEPGKNSRKDSGVLNMSEKDFSLVDLIYNGGKGLPNSREDTQKLLFKKVNKEKLTTSDWKDLLDTINSKPTKAELERHRYYGKKVDSSGSPKLGEKIGNIISGDASCGDMSGTTFVKPKDPKKYFEKRRRLEDQYWKKNGAIEYDENDMAYILNSDVPGYLEYYQIVPETIFKNKLSPTGITYATKKITRPSVGLALGEVKKLLDKNPNISSEDIGKKLNDKFSKIKTPNKKFDDVSINKLKFTKSFSDCDTNK